MIQWCEDCKYNFTTDEQIKKYKEYCRERCWSAVETALLHKHAQPEIVRCKDCKYSVDFYGDGECYCRRPNRQLDWIGDWNFYCGAAERRE